MMKQHIIFRTLLIGIVLISGLFQSCEEVIDVDLNEADPKLSIDAVIDLDQLAQVQLSYTSSYFSDTEPEYETNATVLLSDSEGNTETLAHQGKGKYTGSTIKGKIGNTYELKVTVGNQTFTGESRFMTPTQVLKLEYKKFDGFGGNEDEQEYTLIITLKNNPKEENYYLVKYYIDDAEKEESYSIWTHEQYANEEAVVFEPFFSFTEDQKITIEAFSIDEGTYDYYNQLSDIIDQRGGGGSTPFNPKSNMGKDVLGYFRAWSFDTKSIQVGVEEEKIK